MRVWDISLSLLCRKHLLGEHRELLKENPAIAFYKKPPVIEITGEGLRLQEG